MRRSTAIFAALTFASSAPALAAPASPAPAGAPPSLVKGQEIAVPVTLSDGKALVGATRVSRAGASSAKDGEILFTLALSGLAPYAKVSLDDKVAMPLAIVATGWIGGTKIDEIVLCAKPGAPLETRIAAAAWKVTLRRIDVAPADGCP